MASVRSEPTMRESLTRRALGGIEAMAKLVDDGVLNQQQGLAALKVLVDATLPFVEADQKELISSVVTVWEAELRSVTDTRENSSIICADESEAW